MDISKLKPFTKDQIEDNIYKNSRALQIPENVYKNILKSSLNQASSDIRDIADAMSQQDFVKMQKLSHRIKGAYQNLRFISLGDLCLSMENIAKEKGSIDQIGEHHSKLQEMIASIQTYFDNLET